MGLTKAQLEALNDSSFPNNNSGLITPEILRTYNDAVISNTVNQDGYTTDSASFSNRINAITSSGVPSGTVSSSAQIVGLGFATTASVDSLSASIYTTDSTQTNLINGKLDTSSFNSFSSSVVSEITAIESFTASVSTSVGLLQTFSSSQYKGDSASFDSRILAITASGGIPAGTVSSSTQIVELGFATTASLNAYTQSTNTFTASISTSVGLLQTFSASADSRYVQNSQTSSMAVSSSTYAVTSSYAVTATNASDILVYVKNTTGFQINKGKVVRITSAVGDNALIGTASWDNDSTSANTLGFVTENIANDAFGYVMTQGTLLGVNTDGFTAGQVLYLSASGDYTVVVPPAPYHEVRLGQVLRPQLNAGSIYVTIQNGYELSELHDVNIVSASNNDLLAYNSASGQWENESFSTLGLATTSSVNDLSSSVYTLSQSVDSRLDSLETAGYVTSAITASSLVTASVSQSTITFTKGDGSTFDIVVADISGGASINTGSFATTGSNNFIGNQKITGSLDVSGSIKLVGPETVIGVIQAADADYGPQWTGNTVFQGVGNAGVSFNQFVTTGNYDCAHIESNAGSGSDFKDLRSDTFALETWLNIPTNTGNNPPPQFKRGLGVTGSASFTELTGSLASFSASVDSRINSAGGAPQVQDEGTILGNATSFNFIGDGVTASFSAGTASVTISGGGSINTGSFATTGSNSFIGNQTVNGVVSISGTATYDLDITGGFQATAASRVSGSNGIANIQQTLVSVTTGSGLLLQSFTGARGYMQVTGDGNIISIYSKPSSIGGFSDGAAGGGFAVRSLTGNYYPIQFQSTSSYTDGRVTFTTPLQVNSDITASTILLTGTGTTAIQYNQPSTGSVNGVYSTSYGKDSLKVYQYQGQPYAFNVNLTANQANAYTGSQFEWGLQLNGSNVSLPGGGGTYFAMVSGSTTGSGGGGADKKGLDYLGTAMILDNYADASFRRKVYVDQGMFVSQSVGGSQVGALTVDGTNATNNRAITATGSVDITGSLTVNGTSIGTTNNYAYITSSYVTSSASSVIRNIQDLTVASEVGFSITGSNNTGIKFENTGVYKIEYILQVQGGGTTSIETWFSKNSSPITDTISIESVTSNIIVPITNTYIGNFSVNDVLEVQWSTFPSSATLYYNNSGLGPEAVPFRIFITQIA